MAKDILLDENGDLAIKDGDFLVGDSELQEVGIILQMNQGELKSDPLLGPNLKKLAKGVGGKEKAIAASKLHLARDGKNYEQLKKKIGFNPITI